MDGGRSGNCFAQDQSSMLSCEPVKKISLNSAEDFAFATAFVQDEEVIKCVQLNNDYIAALESGVPVRGQAGGKEEDLIR